ncbi:exotoxin OB-fold domain-containing protein [Staphylococcus aureus]
MLRCHSWTQLENKNTNDRLLKHDLLFHDMFVNDDSKNF